MIAWAFGDVLQTTLGYVQNAAGSTYVVYTRNLLGQVTKAETAEVTYTYTYDAVHRLQTVKDSRGNKTLTYGYSDAALLLTMDDSDGNQTDYEYDPVGRLTHIWAPNDDLVSFIYDEGGRLKEKWFPNGVNTQYLYNPDNTLMQVTNRHGSGNVISRHDYSYDGVGNRKTHLEKIGGTTSAYAYNYDPLSRLTNVTNNTTGTFESYTYDPLGNRLTKNDGTNTLAYTYDTANQLTEIRQGSPTGPLTAGLVYDFNGNLVKKCEQGTVSRTDSDCSGTTTTSLTYDSVNRVIQAAKSGLDTQLYAYDDQGRRIKKAAATNINNYLYNGTHIRGQYDDTWTVPAFEYTYGPFTDTPTIRANGGAAQYYHQNGISNVVAVTNQTGAADGTATYDAWGNITASNGSIPQFGFTGREPDETGLIFYRARYYDPTIGRFIQRDPIGIRGGINRYAYVYNSPTNLVDPEGEFAFIWHGIMTYNAARDRGLGVGQSLTYAWAAMAPDLGFGTWNPSQQAQVGHAMTTDPLQSPAQALAVTETFISRNLQSLDISKQGEALHATQDVPLHGGERWPPEETLWGNMWGTVTHLWRDVVAPSEPYNQAYQRTFEAIDTILAGQTSAAISYESSNFSYPPTNMSAELYQPSAGNLQDMISLPPSASPYSGSQSWGYEPRGIK